MTHGSNIGMIVSFPPARASMEEEFQDDALRLRPGAGLTTVVVEPAILALKAGDVETHNRLVADAAAGFPPVDALMLAHFSMSRAAAAVRAATPIPVLTSPDTAVARLRILIEGEAPEPE